MFKNLQHIDEIEQTLKTKGSSLNKVEQKAKKEIDQKKKPINPNFIFNNLKKKVKNAKYRKPTPPDSEKPKLEIFIGDY